MNDSNKPHPYPVRKWLSINVLTRKTLKDESLDYVISCLNLPQSAVSVIASLPTPELIADLIVLPTKVVALRSTALLVANELYKRTR